jgi:hypothetical protein
MFRRGDATALTDATSEARSGRSHHLEDVGLIDLHTCCLNPSCVAAVRIGSPPCVLFCIKHGHGDTFPCRSVRAESDALETPQTPDLGDNGLDYLLSLVHPGRIHSTARHTHVRHGSPPWFRDDSRQGDATALTDVTSEAFAQGLAGRRRLGARRGFGAGRNAALCAGPDRSMRLSTCGMTLSGNALIAACRVGPRMSSSSRSINWWSLVRTALWELCQTESTPTQSGSTVWLVSVHAGEALQKRHHARFGDGDGL